MAGSHQKFTSIGKRLLVVAGDPCGRIARSWVSKASGWSYMMKWRESSMRWIFTFGMVA
jgi:hypothetical protein